MITKASTVREEFRILGMDCAEEVSTLRRVLSSQPGIFDLTFDVLHGRMAVEFDPERVQPDSIRRLVESTGMRCRPWREPEARAASFWKGNARALLTVLSGASLVGGTVWHIVGTGGSWVALLLHHHEGGRQIPAGALVLYLVAVAAGMFYVAPKAWQALRAFRPEMNALIAVSIVGAGFLGEWSEGATLSFLFSLAGLLETWSMDRARRAVAVLMQVTPMQATVVHGDHEHRVAASDVRVGNLVRVRPGEQVPCDGVVVAGISSVDQALVTGESIAVTKEAGSTVFAGTINVDGVLEIRVSRPPSDSTLSRIVRMVEESQCRRARSDQFIERFSRYYTPAMFVLAFLVTVAPPLVAGTAWSESFYQGMVILLISCPCALVISTPVTIVAALALAARRGVLVKGGAFLERAAQLRAVAFDKTGVLTLGEPRVESFQMLHGADEAEALRVLAGLERGSEHPLARAILRYAAERGVDPVPVRQFQALPGRGVQAEYDGRQYWAGSHRLLLEKGLETSSVVAAMAAVQAHGRSAILFGTDDRVLAVAGVGDPVRRDAAEALDALRRLGVRHLAMLTGDNESAAQHAGRQLGLDAVRAELLPEDKVVAVGELEHRWGMVAMVGDGVNDAQAMSVAGIGVALGRRSTDVALETADVVLMADDLGKLGFLLKHGRRAVRVIQENICIALVLKAAFLALALVGMATLWMAVAADMGATLLVIFNGLRLLRPVRN